MIETIQTPYIDMNINFILLGTIIKKKDDSFSKQQHFLLLYQLIKIHH